jgi:hypothetical protein
MINRKQLLEHAKAQQATDIHICAGAPILFRVGGKLVPITKEKLTAQQSRDISLELLTDGQKALFEKNLDYDLMLADGAGRYRINVGFFNGAIGSNQNPSHPAQNDSGIIPAGHRQRPGRQNKGTCTDNRQHKPGQNHDNGGDDR